MVLLKDRFRFFILFLAWFCLSSINSNLSVFNMVRLCMSDASTAIKYTEHDYNKFVMASAYGTLIATLPFNWVYTKCGARVTFFAAGLISIVSSALVPLCASLGFWWLYAARFVQGLAYASDFCCMGIVCARWSPLKQTAIFISVLTCYSSLSNLISSPIAGLLCKSSLGWEYVFYFHTIASTILMLIWLYFYTDNPAKSRFVNEVEVEKINRGKTKAHINMDGGVPYIKILTDPLVWIIWINAFFEIASGIFVTTYYPTFAKYVLKFDVEKTGFLAMTGPIFHIPFKFIFGICSDKIKIVSELTKMRICNTIAVFLPGICYLGLAYIPPTLELLHITMFSLIGITFASAGGGFYKCASLYSRQHSHFLIANIQVVKAFVMLIGPILMNIFVDDMSQQSQWRVIFVLMAISVFISNVLFCWFVTDKPAKFSREDNKNHQMREIEN